MKPRYAQESHTHAGLTGAGEGWSGIVSACHATATSSTSSLGFTPTLAGLNSSVDTTLSLTGNHMQAKARSVRKYSSPYGGLTSGTTRWINSTRGFHTRMVFGTLAYNSNNPIFAGLCHTVPSSAFATFTGWASTYAMGIYKNPTADTIDWVWRTNSSTTGSASTGLSWRNGYAYTLELDCAAAGSSVTATLVCSYGESASYTFATFPDSNIDPACLLGPACILGWTNTTTQLGFHSFDVVEPW